MNRPLEFAFGHVNEADLACRGASDELLEEHWSYRDRYQAQILARGLTVDDDGDTATGSVHIVGLPDPAAARAFASMSPLAVMTGPRAIRTCETRGLGTSEFGSSTTTLAQEAQLGAVRLDT